MSYSKKHEYLQGVHRQTRKSELVETLLVSALNSIKSAKIFNSSKDYAKTHQLYVKLHTILTELDRALDKRYQNEFCKKQTEIYKYCFNKLENAWFDANSEAIDELEIIFEKLVENWKACNY